MKPKFQRRRIPLVHYQNYRKFDPPIDPSAFNRWFEIKRFWGGNLVEIRVKHHTLVLDFRRDWFSDFLKP